MDVVIMAKSDEGKRFRRDTVAAIRRARELLLYGVQDWAVASTVYLHPDEREDPRVYKRPRRPEEYPEVNAAELRKLYDLLGRVIHKLEDLQGRVRSRYIEVLAEQQREVKKES